MKRNELMKKELSRTLKEMSKAQALSSVTVSALTERCGISRGTFYYHFVDIYDLINWTFDTDIIVPLKEYIRCNSLGSWSDITKFSLEKMYADKKFYCQAVQLEVQNSLQDYMLLKNQESWDLLIEKYLSETHQTYDQETLKFLTHFVSQAIGNMIIDWAKNGMQVPVERMCKMNELATKGIYGMIDSANLAGASEKKQNR